MIRGLILAAPASGAGKTTLTLGLLRACRNRGMAVAGAKSGPDYIDPAFHAAAAGVDCVNLDAWAMHPDRLRALARGQPGELLLIEGAMGLFDGAPPEGRGSTADLAATLGLPVILIVDAARMGQSVAALVAGFAGHRADVRLAGVILTRTGSDRHAALLRQALAPLGLPVLGALPRQEGLALDSRHLGLVQAGELACLDARIDRMAEAVAAAVDLDALVALARAPEPPRGAAPGLPPPGQRVAVATDAAFGFAYAHLLAGWRGAGAELLPFSPLAGQGPEAAADAVFLPGGYPELHAGRLAAATGFLDGLRTAAARGVRVYGECGGYMVLGQGLCDADGVRHAMAGLLELETSFAARRLHLGYRHLRPRPGAPFAGPLSGHEFHYATTVLARGPALFDACDAEGTDLPAMGLIADNVSGSFAHVIDHWPGEVSTASVPSGIRAGLRAGIR